MTAQRLEIRSPDKPGAVTPRTLLAVAALCLLLCGCASGSRFSESALPPLSPEMARLVFIREPHYAGKLISARIKIDGNTVGKLDDGSVIYVDHSPGTVTLSADFVFYPGNSTIAADLRPGQTYFLLVSPREDAAIASTFGILGECADSCGNNKTGGFYQIRLITRQQAVPELVGLTLQASN